MSDVVGAAPACWRRGCVNRLAVRRSGRLAVGQQAVAFGNECRTAGTTGPGHDNVFLGGGLDGGLDECRCRFHGVGPQSVHVLGLCPCLRLTMACHLGRFLAKPRFFIKFSDWGGVDCDGPASITNPFVLLAQLVPPAVQFWRFGQDCFCLRNNHMARAGQGPPHL